MTPDQNPQPVKLVFGLLYRENDLCNEIMGRLQDHYSPLDYQGEAVPFTDTDYYQQEMGPDLKRIVISLRDPVPAQELVSAKWFCREWEQELAVRGDRTVNLDPGYLDLFKLVLASFKGRVNKLYLDRGVWADLTLYYTRGAFHSLPWTFPDFAGGRFDKDLLAIRNLYKSQLRALK